MEKEKKATTTKKAVKKAEPKKATQTKDVAVKPVKAEKVQPQEVKVEPTKVEIKKSTFNQELNLLIGLLSLMTIITFCFAFQGGDAEILGWELVLKSGGYSGVFKGLMILYVVSIFIDCILSIKIDTESEMFNIVEKALYMFTVIMNFVIVAVLLSIIGKVGIGLIIFFIISILSAIIKFARIFAQK